MLRSGRYFPRVHWASIMKHRPVCSMGKNTFIGGVTEVKKIMTLTLVLTVLAMLVGFGVNNARADHADDVVWDLSETTHVSEVEVDRTPIGSIDVEFQMTHREEGGDSATVEVRTTFGEFEEGLDAEQIKIEIEFDDEGVPISGEAELTTNIEGCGEITVEIRFDITDVGEYETEEIIVFDDEGTPFEREVATEVDIEVIGLEIVEAVICGIDFLGEILGDGEISGIIGVSELFVPLDD